MEFVEINKHRFPLDYYLSARTNKNVQIKNNTAHINLGKVRFMSLTSKPLGGPSSTVINIDQYRTGSHVSKYCC